MKIKFTLPFIALLHVLFFSFGFTAAWAYFFGDSQPDAPSVVTYIDAPEPLIGGGGVPAYTHQANAIVIAHVKEVTEPYLQGGISVQQDAQIEVKEVLKGDPTMTQITIKDLGMFFTEGYFVEEGVDALKGKYALLKPGEEVLLFLGTNYLGEYVVFGGPFGTYLIDQDKNVSSVREYKASLEDLKSQIQTELKTPAPKRIPPPPISVEN